MELMSKKQAENEVKESWPWLRSWRGLSFVEALRRLFRLVGDILSILTIAVVIFTSFFCFVLDGYGEKHWFVAMLLYVPVGVWLIPSMILLPLSLVFCFRYSLLLLLFMVGYFYFFSGYQFQGEDLKQGEGPDFTLISNNVGNSARTTIDDFAEKHSPDLMVFQEARPHRYYREKYPNLNVRSHGEFVVVTRFTIAEAEYLDSPTWGAVPIAARYVVDLDDGQKIVVYNTHMPTRRFIMNGIKGRGLISAIFGGAKGYGNQVRTQNRDFFSGQIEMTLKLIEQVEKEVYPVVLVGDLNVPARGYLYGLLKAKLSDTFVEGGRGFGYTFPGETKNPVSFFQPWLRIDHAFTSEKISTNVAEVEKGRPSQHRALAISCRVN